jgi:hypothetical protein
MLATATPSGAGPYTRDWDGALAASPALSPLTVIKGGADGVYKLTGAVVNGLTLTGETGKRLMANVDLLAKSFSTASLAGLSDRVINPIMGHHMSALYIDNAGGTIGTTAFTPLTYSFELALKPGRQGKQGLGEVGISNWQEGDWTGTLKLAAELDATSKAIYDAAIAASDPVGKLVRMVFTDGADVFQWDFAGKILQPPAPFEEFERSLVFNFVLEGSYDTGMANWLAFNLINDVATL